MDLPGGGVDAAQDEGATLRIEMSAEYGCTMMTLALPAEVNIFVVQ